MINIAIFASGSGSNAENIINYFKDNDNISIKIIISNNPHAYVHERAKKLNIKSTTFGKNDFLESYKVLECLQENKIDFIILAGFLLKVPQSITELYNNKIVNIHPALLPKFGGKGMYGNKVHEAVITSKETESGITIHYVNENYDEGNIIFQAKCEIIPSDTSADLANKIHELEYKYFPKVIDEILQAILSK